MVVVQTTTMKDILLKLGLTSNEIKVYLQFHSKQLQTAASVSRTLKMDKSSAYRAVESLKKRGLLVVNGWKNGTLYEAADPNSLHGLLSEKKAELEVNGMMLDELIRDLKTNQNTARSTQISIEKGINSLQVRMTESLSSKEKIIRERFKHHEFFNDQNHVKFVKKFAKSRASKGIFLRQLEGDMDVTMTVFPEIHKFQKMYRKEIRIYPKEFQDNNSIRIWDDYVNIISYDDNGEFIVITIVDKYVASMMKNLYDFVWKFSKPYIS